jgi:outer membrane lipoprotein-sorting protein
MTVLQILKSAWYLFAVTCLLASNALADVLSEIDAYRVPTSSVEAILEISSFGSRAVKYRIAQNVKGESRTVVESSKRKGQQYLYTSRGFWFFAPGTRRAIRVPPLQRLQGQAVLADITQLNFQSDYRVKKNEPAKLNGKSVQKLTLEARTTSSFQTIELWVDSKLKFPVRANFYLRSGKLHRIADYAPPRVLNISGLGPQKMSLRTEFYAPDGEGQKTILTLKSVSLKEFPNRYFNADSLARGN